MNESHLTLSSIITISCWTTEDIMSDTDYTSVSRVSLTVLLALLIRFLYKMYRARITMFRLRKQGLVCIWCCTLSNNTADRWTYQVYAAMESHTRAPVLLLYDFVCTTQRRTPSLSPRHHSTKKPNSRPCLLSGYLAFRSTNACSGVDSWAISNYPRAFSAQISRLEVLSQTNHGGARHCHDGRRSVENLERDLQPRFQCRPSDELD